MGSSTRVAAIVNPAARGGRAFARWQKVESALIAAGITTHVSVTERSGHARVLAGNLIAEGYDTLLAVGGDGTVHEVANGILDLRVGERVCLGVVAAGTGMDIARSLGLPRRPPAIAERIARSRELRIDVGCSQGLDPRYFVNFAETGLGAAVVAREAGLNASWPGRLSFLVAAVGAALETGVTRASIRVDDRPVYAGPLVSVVVANGRYFGGGMRIAPHASPTDGQFDILVLGDFTRAELVGQIWKIYPGTHVHHPKVLWLRGTDVCIEPETPMRLDLDGELSGQGPFHFSLVPGALRVIV